MALRTIGLTQELFWQNMRTTTSQTQESSQTAKGFDRLSEPVPRFGRALRSGHVF